MFTFSKNDYKKFQEIEAYWGTKMPLMACEEFAELTLAVITYSGSTKPLAAFDPPTKNLIEEMGDAIISIFAVACNLGLSITDVYNNACFYKEHDYVYPDGEGEMVIYTCARCIQNISKTVRYKEETVFDTRVLYGLAYSLSELLLRIYYYADSCLLVDDVMKRVHEKTNKKY